MFNVLIALFFFTMYAMYNIDESILVKREMLMDCTNSKIFMVILIT